MVLLGTSQNLAAQTDDETGKEAATLALGKRLAFSPDKGNCLACHVMDDAESGGDLGPPLLYMRARYPEQSQLRKLIFDTRSENPDSTMPPYGAHRILDEKEITAIAEYIHSL